MTVDSPLSRLREKVARALVAYDGPGAPGADDYARADMFLDLIATDEDARELIAAAREDAADNMPAGFTARWFRKGKNGQHDGDCTKKPYTCLRCAYDEHMRITAAGLSALSPSDGTTT